MNSLEEIVDRDSKISLDKISFFQDLDSGRSIYDNFKIENNKIYTLYHLDNLDSLDNNSINSNNLLIENKKENNNLKTSIIDNPILKNLGLDEICGYYVVEGDKSSSDMPLSYWAPRREEIQRIVEVAKYLHKGTDRPKILDVGCGSGFLAYLLALTGEVDVIGIDPCKNNIREDIFSHPNLKFEVGDSSYAKEKYSSQDIDVVLSSWMPLNINLTPDIRDINAKSIVYVREVGGSTGVPDYSYNDFIYDDEGNEVINPLSREEFISYHPGRNYTKVFEWCGPAIREINDISLKSKKKPHYGFNDIDMNQIEVQIRRDQFLPPIHRLSFEELEKYPWEKVLEEYKGKLEPLYLD
jgi:SAM-dependent methyltransferase